MVNILLQEVKAKECTLSFTMFVKLRPTGPLQRTVAVLPEEDSPRIVSPTLLATVMFLSRTCSPSKNTIVVLVVKYNSASCAYSESVVQLVEFWGQDKHEVAVGVTQYTFSAQQQGMLLLSSAAARARNSIDWTIMCWNHCRKVDNHCIKSVTSFRQRKKQSGYAALWKPCTGADPGKWKGRWLKWCAEGAQRNFQ